MHSCCLASLYPIIALAGHKVTTKHCSSKLKRAQLRFAQAWSVRSHVPGFWPCAIPMEMRWDRDTHWDGTWDSPKFNWDGTSMHGRGSKWVAVQLG